MPHVYASLAQFNNHLRDNGATTFADEVAAIWGRKLAILESVSRDIDDYCQRSRFGSGFGPRSGTNRYDGNGSAFLDLEDDLLSITTLTIKSTLSAVGTSHTEETDYISEPYDSTPKRRILGRGTGGSVTFPYSLRSVEIVGSWGYSDTRTTATSVTTEALDASETGIDVTDGGEFSPGQTLLIESEQVYVKSISTNTLTVERGTNGTTAATHVSSSAISFYSYPADVHEACVALALRRWKGRDAGADGSDGGGEMPVVRPMSERAIMETRLTQYRYVFVA